jgi:CMP-2-keto-3-deoxyoctulosonic acid synthetase
MSHSTNTDSYTYMNTHLCQYTHVQPTPMSTSEKLDRLILRFTKSVKKRLVIDGNVVYH